MGAILRGWGVLMSDRQTKRHKHLQLSSRLGNWKYKLISFLFSGTHCLEKADTVLTYMSQILALERNLSVEEYREAAQSFPNEWPLEYIRYSSAASPSWWNTDVFGDWVDLTFVRCLIPSTNSHFNRATRAGGHWCVFAISEQPTDRMGLRPPYNRIQFFRCFACSSLNGTVSLDRHLGAMLKGLSFPGEFRPVARFVSLLNTTAPRNHQQQHILPPNPVQNIPVVTRKSVDRRRNHPLNG